MRAAFMTDVDAIEVREDADEPVLDPRGAVLRVEACGICGTDARTFFNGDPKAPVPWQLGHEPVGVLEEVGPDADLPPGVSKGDRVFLGSILTCGECRWCMEGFQNLCEDHLLYGYDPFPGAYAERAGVPPIAMKNLIPLPPELPSDLATVADPFACALNGIEQLDIRLGDTVVILGTGPIGCWQAVMARDRGASKVYLSDVSADRLEIALDAIGQAVDDAWVAGEDNGVEEVLSRTGGVGAERISVAAPAKPAQQAALEMAAKRAKVVYFAGLPKHDPVSPLGHEPAPLQGAVRAGRLRRDASPVPHHDGLPRPQAGRAREGRHAPVAAREDRRGVRDDPRRHRSEDGRHAVTRPLRDRLRRRQPGDERCPVRRGRRARRLRLRGLRPLVPAPRMGGAGSRPVDGGGGDARAGGWSRSARTARRRSAGSRSDRSSTAWWCATRRGAACAPR